jgi:hypothetical protein
MNATTVAVDLAKSVFPVFAGRQSRRIRLSLIPPQRRRWSVSALRHQIAIAPTVVSRTARGQHSAHELAETQKIFWRYVNDATTSWAINIRDEKKCY